MNHRNIENAFEIDPMRLIIEFMINHLCLPETEKKMGRYGLNIGAGASFGITKVVPIPFPGNLVIVDPVVPEKPPIPPSTEMLVINAVMHW